METTTTTTWKWEVAGLVLTATATDSDPVRIAVDNRETGRWCVLTGPQVAAVAAFIAEVTEG